MEKDSGRQQKEHELIDTQWDVNNYSNSIISIMNDELIDTQWDVNVERLVAVFYPSCELIDTQWDVNIH